MLEFSAYAALGLGGLGIGLLLSLLGNIVSSGRTRSAESDQTPRTYYVKAEIPFAPQSTTPTPITAEEMVKCPCGLELPASSMRDHVTVSGHSKPAALGGTGKVWDLNEAVVETTSPDCYKCGKPVYGLKRMGKTIYVAHLGCTDKTKIAPEEEKSKQLDRPQRKATSQPTSHRCPLCRKIVGSDEEFTRMLSPAGRTTHFHLACVELVQGI